MMNGMNQMISEDCQIGSNVYLAPFVNLYGCEIGDDSKIGAFVEMQRGSKIGKRCKVGSHSFLCDGFVAEDDVFIGHGVMTVNDNHPRAAVGGRLEAEEDWKTRKSTTLVRTGASIGSNVTILGGIEIGAGAIIGAGAVVTKNVPSGATVVGNPTRVIG
ncbi:MAG: transferase hexapeptide repeat containing protein [Candidatus Kaiserbacteria bacterium]|nr:transferase hexapeptide repeat containing protein [Candidatus Kaiserbacteria bacterium]